MSFLRSVEHKASYIRRNIDSQKLNYLYRASTTLLASEQKDYDLPKSRLEYAVLDAIYCFLKHSHWTQARIFRELFIEFLVTDHSVPQDLAESLYAVYLHEISGKSIFDHEDSTRDEQNAERFLRYILVQCFSSENDDELLRDLGFGSKLLKRVRSVVRQSLSPKQTIKTTKPTIAEKAFIRIFKKLSKNLKKNPFIMDMLKLQYILHNPMYPESLETKRYVKAVFLWMLSFGNKNYMNLSKAQMKLANRLNRAGFSSKTADLVQECINTLDKHNLVYPINHSSENNGSKLLALTEDGRAVISRYFAKRFWTKNPNLKDLMSLKPVLMKSAIAECPDQFEDIIRELFFYNLRIIPRTCIGACVERLKKNTPAELISQKVLSLKNQETNSVIKNELEKISQPNT